MKKTAPILTTVLGLLAVGGIVGLLVLFTGAYNVAATAAHFPITHWALNTLQSSSVGARAGSVEGEPPVDAMAVGRGLVSYDDMCVVCHGAPGRERGIYGKGMNPTPPALVEEAEAWTDAELFWITKNGIRIAGMPAFGPTHDDDEIWALVAAMRALPTMTREQYDARIAALKSDPTTGGHGHGEGQEDTHEPDPTGEHTHAPGETHGDTN